MRVGFKMQLHKGFEAEYKKRHDEIWPELVALLKGSGISDYVIFLDETNNSLLGFLKVEDKVKLDDLPKFRSNATVVEIHGRYNGCQPR